MNLRKLLGLEKKKCAENCIHSKALSEIMCNHHRRFCKHDCEQYEPCEGFRFMGWLLEEQEERERIMGKCTLYNDIKVKRV